jgi:hypothetical protein
LDYENISQQAPGGEGMRTAEEWINDKVWCDKHSANIGSFTVYGIEEIQQDAIASERERCLKLINTSEKLRDVINAEIQVVESKARLAALREAMLIANLARLQSLNQIGLIEQQIQTLIDDITKETKENDTKTI